MLANYGRPEAIRMYNCFGDKFAAAGKNLGSAHYSEVALKCREEAADISRPCIGALWYALSRSQQNVTLFSLSALEALCDQELAKSREGNQVNLSHEE